MWPRGLPLGCYLIAGAFYTESFGFLRAFAYDLRIDGKIGVVGIVRGKAHGRKVVSEDGGEGKSDFVAESRCYSFGG